MVNYRGSTGYGQAFADAIFKDQNGAEAKDVLAGVDAALAALPVDRPDAPRHRRRQLRRPAHQLDRHADRPLQGRDPDGRASRTWSASTTRPTTTTTWPWSSARIPHEHGRDGPALGALAAPLRRRR